MLSSVKLAGRMTFLAVQRGGVVMFSLEIGGRVITLAQQRGRMTMSSGSWQVR